MGKGHGNYVCVSQPINHLITSTTLPVWNPLIQYMGINCMMQDLFSLYFLVVDGEHVHSGKALYQLFHSSPKHI